MSGTPIEREFVGGPADGEKHWVLDSEREIKLGSWPDPWDPMAKPDDPIQPPLLVAHIYRLRSDGKFCHEDCFREST